MKILIKLSLIYCVAITIYSCAGKLTQDVIDSRTIHYTLHSQLIKDSFDVYVSFPEGYENSDTRFHTIYYMDANLKSGQSNSASTIELPPKRYACQCHCCWYWSF